MKRFKNLFRDWQSNFVSLLLFDPRRTESFAVAEDRDEELCRQSEVALTMANSRLEVVILSPMSDPRTQVSHIYVYCR